MEQPKEVITLDIEDEVFQHNLELFISKLLPAAVEKGLRKACLIIERSAKKKCPKDDGTLKDSITHEVKNNNGVVGTVVEYAPYVHEGTGIYASEKRGRRTPWRYKAADGTWHTVRGQKPQPFLKDAAEENKQKIIECFLDLLGG